VVVLVVVVVVVDYLLDVIINILLSVFIVVIVVIVVVLLPIALVLPPPHNASRGFCWSICEGNGEETANFPKITSTPWDSTNMVTRKVQ